MLCKCYSSENSACELIFCFVKQHALKRFMTNTKMYLFVKSVLGLLPFLEEGMLTTFS